MSRIVKGLLALGFLAAFAAPSQASPACMKEKTAFALSDDTMQWTMTAAPGSECIQGLRWSYMQIFLVALVKEPKHGRVEIVGSGFRYHANAEGKGPDSFSLLIMGKNKHDPGKSVLEVTVNRSLGTQVSELPQGR